MYGSRRWNRSIWEGKVRFFSNHSEDIVIYGMGWCGCSKLDHRYFSHCLSYSFYRLALVSRPFTVVVSFDCCALLYEMKIATPTDRLFAILSIRANAIVFIISLSNGHSPCCPETNISPRPSPFTSHYGRHKNVARTSSQKQKQIEWHVYPFCYLEKKERTICRTSINTLCVLLLLPSSHEQCQKETPTSCSRCSRNASVILAGHVKCWMKRTKKRGRGNAKFVHRNCVRCYANGGRTCVLQLIIRTKVWFALGITAFNCH